MNISHKKKLWQINVIIDYFDENSIESYRGIVLKLLKDLAALYKLDYSVADNSQYLVSEEESNNKKLIYDIIYFRSNKYTKIEKKEFYLAINRIFKSVPSVLSEGIHIGTQLYKFLKDYPFPSTFYRPLNFPWIEYHDGEQIKLLINSDEILKLMAEKQDYPLN